MTFGDTPDISEPSVWLMAFLDDLYTHDRIAWWLIHPHFRQWFLGRFPQLNERDIDMLGGVRLDETADHPAWPEIEAEAKPWFKDRMPTYDHDGGDWSIVRNSQPVALDIEELRVMRTGPVEGGVTKEPILTTGYLVLMRFDPRIDLHSSHWYLAGFADRIYEPGQGE